MTCADVWYVSNCEFYQKEKAKVASFLFLPVAKTTRQSRQVWESWVRETWCCTGRAFYRLKSWRMYYLKAPRRILSKSFFFSFCVLQSFEPRIERKVGKGGKTKTKQSKNKRSFPPFSSNVLPKELYRLLFLPFSHFCFCFDSHLPVKQTGTRSTPIPGSPLLDVSFSNSNLTAGYRLRKQNLFHGWAIIIKTLFVFIFGSPSQS